MARRLIGLDVGTNAVTIAEVTPGTPPRLDMFAQVALPREAMREGEVNDEAAVSDAVARLLTEVGLKKAAVRVGISSPRVVVRQVEMPLMTRAELASALQFQAADLIPISLEDAVLDFAILPPNPNAAQDGGEGGHGGEGGEKTMVVLLAAAQAAMVMRLVSAVEAGGLRVAAVDLIPLALTRALARPVAAAAAVAENGSGIALAEPPIGAEGIVSFGGGVTSIAVHEGGIPRFVRVIGSGGRELTDAIADDVDVPAETAEALKRALSTPGGDETVTRARTAVDRPLSLLLDEVRSSIDYYRNQPGAARLLRVVATGGGAQLPGLPERLAALVGVQVEPAYMHDLIRIGDIGFAPDELPRLEPYLPAAVGLALGGAGIGTVIDLSPRTRQRASSKMRPRVNRKLAIAVTAGVVIIGGVTFQAHTSASSAKSKQAAAETQVKKLQNQIGHLEQASNPTGQAAALKPAAAALLGQDVGWTKLVGDIGTALPSGVWLTTFQASHTLPVAKPAVSGAGTTGATPVGSASSTGAAASTAASAGANGSVPSGTGSANPAGANAATGGSGTVSNTTCATLTAGLAGTITMAGIARDVPSLSAFLDKMQKLGDPKKPDVTNVWMSSAAKSKFGDTDVLTFSATAVLAPGARSDRLEHFFKEALCK